MDQITLVAEQVQQLLNDPTDGHGFDHVERVRKIALQIAAMNPIYLSLEDVPAEEMERVKAEALASDDLAGKPADIAKKIVAGRIEKYFAEKTLLKQAYIKEESKTVEAVVKDAIAKLGENITIKRFTRIEMGL